MSSPQKIRVAIVGCGNIADRYAERILTYPTCELVGFSDLDPARARAFAAKFGGRAYDSLAQMLADPSIALVVNLTIHFAHYEVVKQCLLAGKHVHTEKPLALRYADAKELVDLAAARGLRLGSAPITYMGEAQQTAWKLLRSGKAGPVRLVYADINHGRIEAWHPNPEPFYEVGIQWDVGVYPLTLLTTMFGPVRRVTATGKVVYPHRVTKEGRKFTITTPDYVLAMLEFEAGLTARLSANFYVAGGKQGQGIGQALCEEVRYDADSGQLVTASFMDYALPRADTFIGFKTAFDTSMPCTTNLLGAKGVGELGTIGATPAVVNAVIDALAASGLEREAERVQMPLSAERVWRALAGDFGAKVTG